MADRPLAPRRGRPARPPLPALWAVATTAVALPIGGHPGQRGPATVGRTPGSVPATLNHLTAGNEVIGLPIDSTMLTAVVAALLLSFLLGRCLSRWLLTGSLVGWRPVPGFHVIMSPYMAARQKRANDQYLEFFNSRLPTSRWCCLSAAASPLQPAYLPKEDGEDGANQAVPLRLPRAEVRQHLEEYGVDVLKVAKRHPPLERYDLERVAVVTSYLAGLGVDVKRAVEVSPKVLAGRVEKYEAVVGLLRANRVDVAHAVTRQPSTLACRFETLQRTMAAIEHCGPSVASVVRRNPKILFATPTGISAMLQLHSLAMPLEDGSAAVPLEPADPTVALFSGVGLDAGLLLKKAPSAFILGIGHLQTAVANLERIGVDVPKVLHSGHAVPDGANHAQLISLCIVAQGDSATVRQWDCVGSAPTVLSLHPETPRRVVQFLSENGLDPVYHINKCPTLLTFSVERKLRPTLTFVVEEMGRSKAELSPSLWNYSLEGRLRPRFRYLQSLGVSRFPLTSFAAFPDVRFAESLADTNLAHYYAWRLANGYPVLPPRRSVSDVITSPLAEDDINFPG